MSSQGKLLDRGRSQAAPESIESLDRAQKEALGEESEAVYSGRDQAKPGEGA